MPHRFGGLPVGQRQLRPGWRRWGRITVCAQLQAGEEFHRLNRLAGRPVQSLQPILVQRSRLRDADQSVVTQEYPAGQALVTSLNEAGGNCAGGVPYLKCPLVRDRQPTCWMGGVLNSPVAACCIPQHEVSPSAGAENAF